MGPPAQENDKISNLTLQLEASLSRCSHLYARLLSTLDTLDYVQSELELERQRNDEGLMSKKTWKERIKELEADKDEMKEVVEIILRKVETYTGDYRDWPRPQMYLPKPVEHSTFLWKNLPEPSHVPAVETLAQVLASEQKAHASTQQALNQAENQIAILNAKVARREAELESCNLKPDGFHSSVPSSQKRRGDRPSRDTKITQTEVVSALRATAQRNRVLEQEINTLAGSLSQLQNPPQVHGDMSLLNPSSPADVPGVAGMASVAVQTSPISLADNHPAYSPNIQTVPAYDPHTTGLSPRLTGISLLENQISLFARAVDKFQEERTALTESIVSASREVRKEKPDPDEDVVGESMSFRRILMIEEECIRLTSIKDSMLDEMRLLREDNNRLRAELHTIPVSTPLDPSKIELDRSSNSTSLSGELSPSRTTNEGEEDMEMSETPLLYSTYHLPSIQQHEEETESLADFTFLSFRTFPPAIDPNSSTHVEAPSESVHNDISSESHSESEGSELERLQQKSNKEQVTHDTDEETTHSSPST